MSSFVRFFSRSVMSFLCILCVQSLQAVTVDAFFSQPVTVTTAPGRTDCSFMLVISGSSLQEVSGVVSSWRSTLLPYGVRHLRVVPDDNEHIAVLFDLDHSADITVDHTRTPSHLIISFEKSSPSDKHKKKYAGQYCSVYKEMAQSLFFA